MKLISWNINGIRAAWKKGFLDFVTAEQPDILCVQETKIQHEQLTPEMRDMGGYRSFWSMAEKKGYSGVATYTKPEPQAVHTSFGSPALDMEGRIVHTEFPDFHLFNVYFPNSGMGPERLAHKLKFYDEFLDLAEGLRKSGKGVIACGDVNTAHTEIDIARPTATTTPSGSSWRNRGITRGGTCGWALGPGTSAGASTTFSFPMTFAAVSRARPSCRTSWAQTTAPSPWSSARASRRGRSRRGPRGQGR